MWWFLTGAFLFGLFGWGYRRTTVNDYNETYVEADCEAGGSGGYDCDDGYGSDGE